MNKYYIEDIYDDGNDLFTNNASLTNSKFDFMRSYFDELDLIAEFKHNRELFKKYRDNNGDYILSRLHRAVYASLTANLEKYKKLISLDETNYNPLDEFDVLKQYGIDKTTKDYDEDKTTKDIDEVHSTIDTGERSATATTAPRTDTTTDYTTAFDTVNEKETSKTVNTTVQTVDSTHANATVDESTTDARQDVTTREARQDVTTRDARVDHESGRRTNAMDLVEKQRAVANHKTLELIVNDTINFVSYAIYL